MNTKYLEYILAVYKHGSISKTAENLFLSQPTLSQHIQKFEKELGVELFNRNTSPLTLTYAGERLIHYAEQILDLEHQLTEEMSDIKKFYIGRLTIGISSSHGNSLLPHILPKYNQLFPNIKVIPIEKNALSLEALALENQVDCIISNLPLQNTSLEYEILRLNQVHLAIPENLLPDSIPRIKEKAPVHFMSDFLSLSELKKDSPFLLLKKGHRVRQIADCLFTEEQFVPSIGLESINIDLVTNLTSIGMGISFMPLNFAKRYAEQPHHESALYPIYLFPLIPSLSNYSLIVAYRSHRQLSMEAKAFIKLLHETY